MHRENRWASGLGCNLPLYRALIPFGGARWRVQRLGRPRTTPRDRRAPWASLGVRRQRSRRGLRSGNSQRASLIAVGDVGITATKIGQGFSDRSAIEPPSLHPSQTKSRRQRRWALAYSAFRYPSIRFSRSRLRMATVIDLSTRQMRGCANRHLISTSIMFSGSIASFSRGKKRGK